MLMQICPKCGNIYSNFPNKECTFCHTSVVITSITTQEINDHIDSKEEEELYQKLFEKYVFPSSEYDKEIFNKQRECEADYLAHPEKYSNTIHTQQPSVCCPKCNSTQIQAVSRRWSLFSGFLTNKVDRVCLSCGYKF